MVIRLEQKMIYKIEENKQFLKISKPKMDFNQYRETLCVHHQRCSFQTSKFKYFSDKMTKKSNSIAFKNTEENYNNNSFFSSKTYPNISNSVLAYVVGGFVGSKSQMNNNNHNLLYDLSAVISNILNSSKCENDKTSPKKSENSYMSTSENFHDDCPKFIMNESSQRKEKMKNPVNDEVDFSHYIDMPVQTFIDKERETCNYNENHDSLIINTDFKLQCCDTIGIIKVISEVCNNQSSEYNSLEDVCLEIATAESLNEIQSPKSVKDCDTNMCRSESQAVQLESFFKENISETQNTLEENHTNISGSSNSNECDSNSMQKNVSCNLDFIKPTCTLNSSCSSNFLAKERFRQQSECSVESTDSESFIVFEEPCSLNGDKEKPYFTSDDDFESTICSEDDYSEDEGESGNDSGINSTINDNYEFCNVNTVEENKNGLLGQNDVTNHKFKASKKVRFNNNVKVNKIIAWDHAYRTARVGPWEQMARDRFRFHERILALSQIISPVLSIKHRTKVFNNLYS